jgi:hypothetical protein
MRLKTLTARTLGLSPVEAEALLRAMRARNGSRSLRLRAAAFAIATSPPARVVPASVRRRALVGFVGPLLETPVALALYGGGLTPRTDDPCAGLADE